MSEINLVMRAVGQGYRTTREISAAAGLPLTKTRTYLTRLQSRNLVESELSPNAQERASHLKHYRLAGIGICLLQQLWK
mgnify:CR=1 FL=1